MSTNPFSMTFGKTPQQHIERVLQSEQIVSSFESENPVSQVYIITGVRGAGKTVMLTSVAKHFKEAKDWIVIHLNPDRDLLNAFAAKLNNALGSVEFSEKSIGVSPIGLSASASTSTPLVDPEVVIEKLVQTAKKKNKKILITIDEVSSNAQVRAFISSFQILLRGDYPVFLLMTGLYKNIRTLQDSKTMTFLYRAPKIELAPLSLAAICASYEEIFDISKKDAAQVAKMTSGYPFAYQVLGYLLWESGGSKVTPPVLRQYDKSLSEYAYEKIWSELSSKDKKFLSGMSHAKDNSTASIMNSCGWQRNEISVYKKRLEDSGLIHSPQRGKIQFTLPRFSEFIDVQEMFEF